MEGQIDPASDELNADEKELIKQLRTEVFQLKDCISKYTIQALVFAAAAIGIILKFQAENFADKSQGAFRMLLGCASLPLLFPLRAVARTAIHKLGTINRNLGYELHLQRSRSLISRKKGWRNDFRKIGWEEAMRAWRVVQATLFAALCKNSAGEYRRDANPRGTKGALWGKKRTSGAGEKYFWYDVATLVRAAADSGAPPNVPWYRFKQRARTRAFLQHEIAPDYHPGNYVKKMVSIIHRSMLACLFPLLLATFAAFFVGETLSWTGIHGLALVIGLASVVYLAAVFRDDNTRVRQLEAGVLSIHSCAIVWRAVVVAHFRAIESQQRERNTGRPTIVPSNGYTYLLAQRAMSLARNRFRIHEWTDGQHSDRMYVAPGTAVTIEDVAGQIRDISVDGRGLLVGLDRQPRLKVGQDVTARVAGRSIALVCRYEGSDSEGKATLGLCAQTAVAREVLLQIVGQLTAAKVAP